MPNKQNPLISIIMPNYNGARFISQAITSVLAQTYPHWELIVCDDCSSDDSLDVIKGFTDSRIQPVLRLKTNQGAAIARNMAIEIARGDFIGFLDNDDYWETQKLETQITYMQQHSYEFTFTDYFQFSQNSRKYIKCKKKVTYGDLLKNNYILTSTVVYNAKVLGKVYMENIRKRQDWSLFINIIKLAGAAYNLPVALTNYRRHKDSMSANKFTLLRHNFNFYNRVLGFSRSKSFFLLLRFLIYYLIKKLREGF